MKEEEKHWSQSAAFREWSQNQIDLGYKAMFPEEEKREKEERKKIPTSPPESPKIF